MFRALLRLLQRLRKKEVVEEDITPMSEERKVEEEIKEPTWIGKTTEEESVTDNSFRKESWIGEKVSAEPVMDEQKLHEDKDVKLRKDKRLQQRRYNLDH